MKIDSSRIACVLAFALFVVGCEKTESHYSPVSREGASVRTEGIVDGKATGYPDKWAGVVAIIAGYGSLCTGTLIHPQVVLSAGHCVKVEQGGFMIDWTRRPRQVKIRGGANAFSADSTSIATAKKIITHPSWTGRIEDAGIDLSLILLDREVTTISTFGVRDFPMPKMNDAAYIVGYGDDGNNNSGIQREGDTTILEVLDELIQIGGQSNTCPGDSGGPVFIEQDGEWKIAGVNSFGFGTVCDPEQGMYSVNPLFACNWLNTTMKELVNEDLGLEGCSLCDVEPVEIWGRPCGEGWPTCPGGSQCLTPEGFSFGGFGYCAAPCCDYGVEDAAMCSDIGPGKEVCSIRDESGTNYCAVECEDDSDCSDNLTCKKKPFTDEKICIATAAGDGTQDKWEDDPGETEDTDSETNGDGDSTNDAGIADEPPSGSSSSGTGCQLTSFEEGTTSSLLSLLVRSI